MHNKLRKKDDPDVATGLNYGVASFFLVDQSKCSCEAHPDNPTMIWWIIGCQNSSASKVTHPNTILTLGDQVAQIQVYDNIGESYYASGRAENSI